MTPLRSDTVTARPSRRSVPGFQKSPGQAMLETLLTSGVVLAEDWEALSPRARAELAECAEAQDLHARLLEHGLLTQYQVSRLEAGNTFGLVLGSYRVLERLGSGGMGIVFRAEHMRLRRQVAIKVLHPTHA